MMGEPIIPTGAIRPKGLGGFFVRRVLSGKLPTQKPTVRILLQKTRRIAARRESHLQNRVVFVWNGYMLLKCRL
jgi:hypothetical protein